MTTNRLPLLKFIVLMTFLVAIINLESCSEKKEYVLGAPTKNSEASNNDSSRNSDKLDLISPEVTNPQNPEFEAKNIFDLWDLFFKTFVPVISEDPFDTRVNFKSLHQLREARDKDFLDLVSIIEKKMASFDIVTAPKNEKAAFYINAYNYSAIRIANKGYVQKDGIIKSIRDLSKTFNPFEILTREVIPFKSGLQSLDDIMKNSVRDIYTDDDGRVDVRFYFALNGATMGRGILLNEAYRPEKLEAQLNFALKNGLKIERLVKLDDDTLRVARFMKWYKEDFEKYTPQGGSLEDFFSAVGVDSNSYKKIRYQDFSWELNDLTRYPGIVVSEPAEPLPPIQETEEEDIIPAGPCDFLESEKVSVLSYCDRVIEGEMNGFYRYDYNVIDAKICVYKRKLDEKTTSLGIIGEIVEVNNETNLRENRSLAVEDVYKEDGDQLRFRISEGVRTTTEYLKTDQRIMIRQTSVLPGKGYRKFLLQCR